MQLLLRNGANPNLSDSAGKTALFYHNFCAPFAVKILLRAGADPNHQSLQHKTPLQSYGYGSPSQEEPCVQALLNAGAKPILIDTQELSEQGVNGASANQQSF